MHPSLAAILGAALFAATAPAAGEPVGAVAQDDGVALGRIPADDLEGLLLEALPTPPTTVVRNTNYFGTVTLDHAAHLRRKASCKKCHDPGPVGKIAFTAKVAHTRCIGCHEEVAKGPTKCQGCHVKPEPPPVVAVVEKPAPPAPNPANVSAAIAAFDAPRLDAGGVPLRQPFHRSLDLGLSAGSGQGFSVRLASYQDWKAFTVSVDRLSSESDARTTGFLGAGITRQVLDRVSLEAVGLVGFDVIERPLVALLPAVGLRAGAVWYPRMPVVSSLSLSLTTLLDLGSHEAGGTTVGGGAVYATISTGFSLSRN